MFWLYTSLLKWYHFLSFVVLLVELEGSEVRMLRFYDFKVRMQLQYLFIEIFRNHSSLVELKILLKWRLWVVILHIFL